MAIDFTNIDSRLDKILEPTYGQLIFQEQVTEIAQQLAGWTAGQADKLRKAIGRKIPAEMAELMPTLHKAFVDYGGISEKGAETLCTGIENCASYSFNKSHSVEYGLIAYQTAYLKANYPLEYMCSLLNANYDSEEDIIKYKAECERMGIEILPPSVKTNNLRYQPEGNGIRMGLNSIKGINDIKLDYFTNFNDWISKNDSLNKRTKEALIKAGACDCFGLPRKTMLCKALGVFDKIKNYEDKIADNTIKLTNKTNEYQSAKDGTKKKEILKGQIERLKETITRYQNERDACLVLLEEPYDEIAGEKEVLGFTFKDEFTKYDTSKYPVYNANLMGVQTFYANVVSVKKITDKRGKPMAFITAIPYKHKQRVEFVMFASRYQPVSEGVCLLRVDKKTQITGYEKLR